MKTTRAPVRDTAQRRAIRASLEKAGRPLGALEVLRSAKALVEAGEVAAVELPGAAPRYEFAGKEHHHHFLCSSCDKVYELGGCLGGLRQLLPRGFSLGSHELLLHGTCASCSRR
jgi:Fur family transcriptional regulator, ferric uptake regulator